MLLKHANISSKTFGWISRPTYYNAGHSSGTRRVYFFPSGAITIICVGNFSYFCVFSRVIMFNAVIRTSCDDSLPSGDTELLLMPDERTAQKKVSSLFQLGWGASSFLSHSIIYLHSFTPAKKQINQERGQKGEIKARRIHVIVGCSRADWLMLLSSRARLRGRPGPARSAALFYVRLKCLHVVCKRNQMWYSEKKDIVFSD